MPMEMGTTYENDWPCVATAATASTSKISSVAYAVEESASEEKTASAVFFDNRSCIACSVLFGLPTRKRLSDVTISAACEPVGLTSQPFVYGKLKVKLSACALRIRRNISGYVQSHFGPFLSAGNRDRGTLGLFLQEIETMRGEYQKRDRQEKKDCPNLVEQRSKALACQEPTEHRRHGPKAGCHNGSNQRDDGADGLPGPNIWADQSVNPFKKLIFWNSAPQFSAFIHRHFYAAHAKNKGRVKFPRPLQNVVLALPFLLSLRG